MHTPGLCQECDLLWREFAHATGRYATLVLERQSTPDGEAGSDLDCLIDRAARERQRVRKRIADHQAAEHPETTENDADLSAA